MLLHNLPSSTYHRGLWLQPSWTNFSDTMAVKSTRPCRHHHPQATEVKKASRYLLSHRGTVPIFLRSLIISKSHSTRPIGTPYFLQWSADDSLRAYPTTMNNLWARGPSRPRPWISRQIQFLRKADCRFSWISIAPAAWHLALRWPVRASPGKRSARRSATSKVRCIWPLFQSSGPRRPPRVPDGDYSPSTGHPISHSVD